MIITHTQTQPPTRFKPPTRRMHNNARWFQGIRIRELQLPPVYTVGVGGGGDAEEEMPGEDVVGVREGGYTWEGGF